MKSKENHVQETWVHVPHAPNIDTPCSIYRVDFIKAHIHPLNHIAMDVLGAVAPTGPRHS